MSSEKAVRGLQLSKESVIEYLESHPGCKNSDIGNYLGLQNSRRGGQHGYLVWTVLGHLIEEGRVQYHEDSKTYSLKEQGRSGWMRVV